MARNLTAVERDQIRELRYVRGLSRQETAVMVGCSPQAVSRHAPGRGLPLPTRARIRRLRYGDGLTRLQAATVAGVSVKSVGLYAPGRPGAIDNARLREEFLRAGTPAADVARRVGWTFTRRDGRVYVDTARVRRALGLQDDVSRGYRWRRVMIDAETAALLAEAIGVAPWEVGADATVEHLANPA